MTYRILALSLITGLSVLLSEPTNAVARHSDAADSPPAHSTEQATTFRSIDQPLWIKIVVTGSGIGLIGLELWWFVLSRPTSSTSGRQ